MSLHVEVRGQGPDLVLLHGWALHGGMWGPWLDELALHARLHLVDLPGHGHSPWAPGLAGLADLARAVGRIVPQGAVLVGWSLGGMIALELARQEPQRASAMVLLATTPRFVAGGDWPHGMDAGVLDEFARGLGEDHRGTVQNFLALQARGDERALETLRLLRRNLDAHGPPDPRALAAGLGILRTAVGCAELGHHRRGAPGPADDHAPVHPLGDLGVAVRLRRRIGQFRLPRVGAEAVDVERRDDLSPIGGRGRVGLRRCGVGEVREQGLLLPPQRHLGCRGPDDRRDLGVAGADGRIEVGAVTDQALQRRTAREGLVDQLEAEKLVTRRTARVDSRFVYVDLTAAGEKLVTTMFPAMQNHQERALRGLTAADIKTLRRLLNVILQNIEAAD